MINFLLLQTAAQVDTVVMVPARDAVDVVMAVAAGSLAATFLSVLFLLAVTIRHARNASRSVQELGHKISIDPGVESLRKTAANVEEISKTLRGEVTRLSTSISHLSDRLQQASDRMEERIDEFNALLEVVQGEAEGAFVDGAATARGVRAGLGSLSTGRKKGPSPPPGEEAES